MERSDKTDVDSSPAQAILDQHLLCAQQSNLEGRPAPNSKKTSCNPQGGLLATMTKKLQVAL
jgi:hypothetical protein